MANPQPADWYPDPSGLHDHRYWDGSRWTDQVATNGSLSVDMANISNEQTQVMVTPEPAIEPYALPTAQAMVPYAQAPMAPDVVYQAPTQQPPMHPAANMAIHAAPQQPRSTVVVVQSNKSAAVAFLLTFFFGPFGMFYSTVAGALIMLFVSFFAALFTFGLSLFITWPICIIWGMTACSSAQPTQVHNYY